MLTLKQAADFIKIRPQQMKGIVLGLRKRIPAPLFSFEHVNGKYCRVFEETVLYSWAIQNQEELKKIQQRPVRLRDSVSGVKNATNKQILESLSAVDYQKALQQGSLEAQIQWLVLRQGQLEAEQQVLNRKFKWVCARLKTHALSADYDLINEASAAKGAAVSATS